MEQNPLFLEKQKYGSHTITHLTVFTCLFSQMQVENLLKGTA